MQIMILIGQFNRLFIHFNVENLIKHIDCLLSAFWSINIYGIIKLKKCHLFWPKDLKYQLMVEKRFLCFILICKWNYSHDPIWYKYVWHTTTANPLILFSPIFSTTCGTHYDIICARNINIYKKLRGVIIYLRNHCCESISQWLRRA